MEEAVKILEKREWLDWECNEEADVLYLSIGKPRMATGVVSGRGWWSDAWSPIYAWIAETDGLPWKTLDAVVEAVRCFLNPVLANVSGRWAPDRRHWEEET